MKEHEHAGDRSKKAPDRGLRAKEEKLRDDRSHQNADSEKQDKTMARHQKRRRRRHHIKADNRVLHTLPDAVIKAMRDGPDRKLVLKKDGAERSRHSESRKEKHAQGLPATPPALEEKHGEGVYVGQKTCAMKR